MATPPVDPLKQAADIADKLMNGVTEKAKKKGAPDIVRPLDAAELRAVNKEISALGKEGKKAVYDKLLPTMDAAEAGLAKAPKHIERVFDKLDKAREAGEFASREAAASVPAASTGMAAGAMKWVDKVVDKAHTNTFTKVASRVAGGVVAADGVRRVVGAFTAEADPETGEQPSKLGAVAVGSLEILAGGGFLAKSLMSGKGVAATPGRP